MKEKLSITFLLVITLGLTLNFVEPDFVDFFDGATKLEEDFC